MYIDEVGNSDLGSSGDPNHRYLSLTGVICELSIVERELYGKLESLKAKFFDSHPDDPIILHRKELVNKKHPFAALRDPVVEADFNREFLFLLESIDYTVITVVIDKFEHKHRYDVWLFDPYHYGLHVLLERYVFFLRANGGTGDVLAESRGGNDDRRLKDSFKRVFTQGTDFMKSELFGEYLTSCELKVKPKQVNIAGLQIADVIAHPSYKWSLLKSGASVQLGPFGEKVAALLEESKYYRSPSGKVEGYGRKVLP